MIARVRQNDSGLTLIELLVAMGILALLLTMIGALGLRVFRSSTETVSLALNQGEYQVAMQRIARQFRYVGVPNQCNSSFDSITGSSVAFYSYSLLDGVTQTPNQVTITINNGTVTENVMPQTTCLGYMGSGAAPAPVSRPLLTGVDNVSGPVFTFYTSPGCSGSPMTIPAGGLVSSNAQSLVKLQSLRCVKVTLRSLSATPALNLVQSVVFQNLL